MKLSIITPQYKEGEDVIKPLLSSIENQVGFNLKEDLEVIVVNDGSDTKLSDRFIKSFKKLSIKYIFNEKNGGPSVARNTGLKNAVGEYVIFCDADDRFLNAAALMQITSAIQKDQAAGQTTDLYNWDFIEELLNKNTFQYIKHSEDFIFLHGNVYRKKFLDENSITFCDELRKDEDVYFNAICRSLSKNIRIMTEPLYIWCHNPHSISREPESQYSKYPLLVKTARKIVENLLERNNERASLYVVQFHYHTYFQMQTPRWLESKRKEFKRIAEQEFCRYHEEYKHHFAKVSGQMAANLYAQERRNVLEKSGCIEAEAYQQFLERIKKNNAEASHKQLQPPKKEKRG